MSSDHVKHFIDSIYRRPTTSAEYKIKYLKLNEIKKDYDEYCFINKITALTKQKLNRILKVEMPGYTARYRPIATGKQKEYTNVYKHWERISPVPNLE